MRTSIAYLTTTATTVPAALVSTGAGAHRLELLGWHRGQRAAYLTEDVGGPVPLIHVVRTRGAQAGRMVAMRTWYDGEQPALLTSLDRKLSALRAELSPMEEIEHDAWSLTTRVVQRRALRLPAGGLPIRKFALQLTVEPIVQAGHQPHGRTVVTAYLRARAHLDRMWAVPGEPLAIARLSYIGVPEGIGLDKQVAVLVGRELH